MKTIGVVLAGGSSTRFGSDKALFELNGKPMYEHIVDILHQSECCDEIVINTNADLKNSFPDYRVIVDDENFKDHGPLGGLYAVQKHFENARYIVLSCDTPFVSSDWVQKLIQHSDEYEDTSVITSDDEQMHPTISVFNDKLLDGKLVKQFETGKLSMRAFFENILVEYLNVEDLGFDKRMLLNINRLKDVPKK